MTERGNFGVRAMTAVEAGSGALIGGVTGLVTAELLILPYGFPDEFADYSQLNHQKTETQRELNQSQGQLNQVRGSSAEGVDYTKLQEKVAALEIKAEVLQDTSIPFDAIQTETDLYAVGGGMLLGALVGAARYRLGLRRERQNQS